MATIVPAVVLHSIVLSWINKLEKKCECSADWRRDYIKYFSIASIVLAILTGTMHKPNKSVIMLFGAAGLVNVGAILSYIPKLKKNQCECATENEWRDNFIFWWIIISLIVTILGSGAAAFMLTRK